MTPSAGVGAVVFLLFLLGDSPSSADTVPTGPNFRVNSVTDGNQYDPAVAADGAGNFVVVWTENRDYGGRTVVGQRLDPTGTRLGDQFAVTSHPPFESQSPVLAVAPSGSFLVAWEDFGADGSLSGIYARRLDASGTPQGPEFLVNTHTVQNQACPSAAADGAGNFIVTWHSLDPSARGAFAQRYDPAGVPLGGEFQVNAFTTDSPVCPAVAADGAGNFVIVWQGFQGGIGGIFGRRFDATGTPQGSEFRADSGATESAFVPGIAATPAGDFAVAWFGGSAVYARHFDAGAAPLSPEVTATTDFPLDTTQRAKVAIDAAGNFMAAWGWGGLPTSKISAHRFASDGTSQGGEFLVNVNTLIERNHPGVAGAGAGSFLVAWADRIGFDVIAQRFSAGCGNGTLESGEGCDDGNNAGGDGCDATCRAETCFACTGAPSTCAPITTCTAGDGCCAPGCTSATDPDCPTLISGAVLAIRSLAPPGRPDTLTLKLRDPSIDTTVGTGIDPIADDAVLHVYDASGGGRSACYELRPVATAAWRQKGASATGPTFLYTDPDGRNPPCKVVRVKDGGPLRARCAGTSLGIGADMSSAGVRFISGTTTYCAQFGGTILNDGIHRFVARSAPAPAVCPTSPLPCPLHLPLGP